MTGSGIFQGRRELCDTQPCCDLCLSRHVTLPDTLLITYVLIVENEEEDV